MDNQFEELLDKMNEPIPFDIQFGLMVLDESDTIVHFCGYENEPTEADLRNLHVEVGTDESFGLVGRDDLRIVTATKEVVEKYRKDLEVQD